MYLPGKSKNCTDRKKKKKKERDVNLITERGGKREYLQQEFCFQRPDWLRKQLHQELFNVQNDLWLPWRAKQALFTTIYQHLWLLANSALKKQVWKMNFMAHLPWIKPCLAINRHSPNGMDEFRLFLIHTETGAGPACLTKQLGPALAKQTCSKANVFQDSPFHLLSPLLCHCHVPFAFPFFFPT